MKVTNNNRGSALLMTVLIMTSILVVSVGIASLVTPGILMGRTQIRSTKAYFAAETGAERTLRTLRADGFNLSSCVPGVADNVDMINKQCVGTKQNYTLDANNASYYVTFTSIASTTFRSVGTYLNTNRVIEISLN